MLSLEDRWIWDFWLADTGSHYHVFYLQAPKSLGDPHLRHRNATVGHAISDDLVAWTVLPDALLPGPAGTWDDVATWTGSIIRDGDRWHMFYTGCSTRDGGLIQRVGLATSADLSTWEKHPANPIIVADARWYELLDLSAWHDQAWRDPWVFADLSGEGFHALITARARDGEPRSRGVIAHARSMDLVRWEVGAPVTTPGEFGHMEVPQVELVDGRAILVFSCGADEIGPARRARLPGEGSGSFYVAGASPVGPFDVSLARCVTPPGIYSAKIVRRRDGAWVALGFVDQVDGRFVGALSDPMPVALAV